MINGDKFVRPNEKEDDSQTSAHEGSSCIRGNSQDCEKISRHRTASGISGEKGSKGREESRRAGKENGSETARKNRHVRNRPEGEVSEGCP